MRSIHPLFAQALGHRATPLAALVLVCGSVTSALAQPTIVSIGTLAGDQESYALGLSADARAVVGISNLSAFDLRAVRWTDAEGMINLGSLPSLPQSQAVAANVDGSIIVGYCGTAPSYPDARAYRWTSSGIQSLGVLPGGNNSYGTDVSDDGEVVVGMSRSSNGRRAFRWTNATGMQDVGVPTGWPESRAEGVSGDGSTIVGCGHTTDFKQFRAFRWTSQGGFEDLGEMGGPFSQARGVNHDGSVVVGDGIAAKGSHAFRWTKAGGMQDLGILDDGKASVAYAVSADGSRVVGSCNSPGNDRAVLWTAELGMVNLNNYLLTLGVDLTGWELVEAKGISADGSAITGIGLLDGEYRGWLVSGLPVSDACYPDCDGNDSLDIDDFVCFQTFYALGDPYADCDGSGSLDIDDFICFQTLYAIGC